MIALLAKTAAAFAYFTPVLPAQTSSRACCETGKLRRQIAETLAVLAADHDRQDRVSKAAQQLAVSGEFSDANTVGNVGYTLAKKGYAPSLARQILRLVTYEGHMPWQMRM